ncbi:hypothetical protein DFH07DRAFT_857002 [Mycena maculata]|uniref:Postreplication repair E3 ubiquitin-protein ligase RAD18 n=1 Tax=Mycena maculata TaxID=230809 RepID=A0AAD7MKW1_9AGAR|nr:hypothetical protein DFH07DRAFT_857002 [Mycena maculata]
MVPNLNSNKLSTLLAQDIPDPTDFPKESSSLSHLDTATRCQICSNFLEGPVTISCGHCFCSVCIRDFMASSTSRAQCPTCRTATSETQIRPNPGIEEVVTAWKLARPYILSLARREQEPAEGPANKKRKLSHASSPCIPGPSRTPSTESRGGLGNLSSDAPEGDVPKADAVVECPLCAESMKYRELNTHMDNNCSSGKPSAPPSKSQKAQWSDIMGGQSKAKGKAKEKAAAEDDYLPKVSYDTLKEKQLREKLASHGLPTTGNHKLLAARHQRWSMLWNANLDKSAPNRQSKNQLLKEVKKWEEDRNAKKKKTEVDKSHLVTQKAEFDRLVAAARPKKAGAGMDDAEVVSSPPPSKSSFKSSEDDVIIVDSDDEEAA